MQLPKGEYIYVSNVIGMLKIIKWPLVLEREIVLGIFWLCSVHAVGINNLCSLNFKVSIVRLECGIPTPQSMCRTHRFLHTFIFRFTVMHILSDAEKSWGGTRGRIGETLIRRNLPVVNPENSQEALVCICGPEPFTTAVTK